MSQRSSQDTKSSYKKQLYFYSNEEFKIEIKITFTISSEI